MSHLGETSPRPKVSVVIPVFNAEASIERALKSILAQTETSWEAILVNDGSKDKSAHILEHRAAADDRIKAHHIVNSGAGPARNFGMSVARGDFIAFLDADDEWHPEKLSRQIAFMEANEAALSCTAYRRCDAETGGSVRVGVPFKRTRNQLLKTNSIACSSAIFRRAAFSNVKMPSLRRRQDFAFWLSLLEQTECAYGFDEVLMTYHKTPGSVSSSKSSAAADTWRLYRHHLKLPAASACYYFLHYAVRGVVRHKLPGFASRLGWQ